MDRLMQASIFMQNLRMNKSFDKEKTKKRKSGCGLLIEVNSAPDPIISLFISFFCFSLQNFSFILQFRMKVDVCIIYRFMFFVEFFKHYFKVFRTLVWEHLSAWEHMDTWRERERESAVDKNLEQTFALKATPRVSALYHSLSIGIEILISRYYPPLFRIS